MSLPPQKKLSAEGLGVEVFTQHLTIHLHIWEPLPASPKGEESQLAGACRGGTAFPPEIIVKNDAKTQISLAITLESEIFVVYLQRNKTNTIMSEAELVLVEEAKKCTLYTIQFLSEDETEFEQFFTTLSSALT